MELKLNAEDKFLSEVEMLLETSVDDMGLEELDIIYEWYKAKASPQLAAKKVREYLTRVGGN